MLLAFSVEQQRLYFHMCNREIFLKNNDYKLIPPL